MKLKLAKEKNRWHLDWSNETNSYVQFYPSKATYLNDKKLTVSSLAIYSSGIIVNIISLAILALCAYNRINTMYVLSFSFGGLLFICFQFNETFDGWFSDIELINRLLNKKLENEMILTLRIVYCYIKGGVDFIDNSNLNKLACSQDKKILFLAYFFLFEKSKKDINSEKNQKYQIKLFELAKSLDLTIDN